MKLIFTFIILLFSFSLTAQNFNQLLLRKNGITIKRFEEGSVIHLKTKLGMEFSSTIYLIQNDSIYFSETGIHVNDIAAVYKNIKRHSSFIPVDKSLFLKANAGIPLFAAGLTISGEPFLKSLLTGIGIVYIPLVVYNIKNLVTGGGKKFHLGKKYDLLVLDIHPAEIVPQKKQ